MRYINAWQVIVYILDKKIKTNVLLKMSYTHFSYYDLVLSV